MKSVDSAQSLSGNVSNEKKFVKAPTIRRLVAFLLDFVLLVVCTGILYTLAVRPIATSMSSYKKSYQEFKEVLYESGLYESHEKVEYIKIYENSDHDFYYIDEKLTAFYENYDQVENYTKIKANHIENTIEENRLFYLDEQGTYLPIESKLTSEEMKAWLKSNVDNAITGILENSEAWLAKATVVSEHLIRQLAVTLIITSLIFYLVFPLAFKGPTIGKKLMGLRVYNFKKKNYSPTPLQLLLRYFFFVLIEILIGIYTLGIVPLASFLVASATKKGQAFHDFISSTSVCEYQEEKVNPEDSFTKQAQAIQ